MYILQSQCLRFFVTNQNKFNSKLIGQLVLVFPLIGQLDRAFLLFQLLPVDPGKDSKMIIQTKRIQRDAIFTRLNCRPTLIDAC